MRDRRLRRAVDRCLRHRLLGREGRDRHEIGHAPGRGCVDELAHERMHGRQHAAEIDRDHPVPVVGAAVEDRRQWHQAGVGDHEIDGPELFGDARGGGIERRAIAHVGRNRQHRRARLAQFIREGVEAVGAAGQERDARATGGEPAGGCRAHAAGGSGHDRDAAGQTDVWRPLLPSVLVGLV
jgi:hypothetical protein